MPYPNRVFLPLSRRVLAIALCAAGCNAPAANDPAAADQVRAAMAAYMASVKVGADSMTTFFADSGALLAPGLPPVIGRKAIGDFIRSMFGQFEVGAVGEVVQAVDVTGDVATLWGTYHETITPRGGEASALNGRFVSAWRKGSDGRWRITLMMTQPDPASASAAPPPPTKQK